MRAERRPLWRRLMNGLASAADEFLPMSPEEREDRDTAGLDGNEVARRRRLRIKLEQLGKRGKGGYR